MTADHDVQNNKNSTYTWKDSCKTSPDERLVHRVCGDFWRNVPESSADAALSRHVCSQRVGTRLSAHTVQSSVGRRRWESHLTHSDGATAKHTRTYISSTVCNLSLNVTQQHTPNFSQIRTAYRVHFKTSVAIQTFLGNSTNHSDKMTLTWTIPTDTGPCTWPMHEKSTV